MTVVHMLANCAFKQRKELAIVLEKSSEFSRTVDEREQDLGRQLAEGDRGLAAMFPACRGRGRGKRRSRSRRCWGSKDALRYIDCAHCRKSIVYHVLARR